jgi:hypothetical protein
LCSFICQGNRDLVLTEGYDRVDQYPIYNRIGLRQISLAWNSGGRGSGSGGSSSGGGGLSGAFTCGTGGGRRSGCGGSSCYWIDLFGNVSDLHDCCG